LSNERFVQQIKTIHCLYNKLKLFILLIGLDPEATVAAFPATLCLAKGLYNKLKLFILSTGLDPEASSG
jgi:hypothetical protein